MQRTGHLLQHVWSMFATCRTMSRDRGTDVCLTDPSLLLSVRRHSPDLVATIILLLGNSFATAQYDLIALVLLTFLAICF